MSHITRRAAAFSELDHAV
jgi:hypothetical protein